MLRFCQRFRVVYRTTVPIIRGVRISEGQIIRAILYVSVLHPGKVRVYLLINQDTVYRTRKSFLAFYCTVIPF